MTQRSTLRQVGESSPTKTLWGPECGGGGALVIYIPGRENHIAHDSPTRMRPWETGAKSIQGVRATERLESKQRTMQ